MFALNNSLEIQPILSFYDFNVFNINGRLQDYLLDTDRGIKRLVFWKQIDALKWSFFWREKLAENGYRYIDRFIRTRYGEPYVNTKWGAYTVTDYYEGDCINLTEEKDLGCMGRLHALSHTAMEAARSMYNSYPLYRESIMQVQENRGRLANQTLEFHARKQAIMQRIQYTEKWLKKGVEMGELEGLIVAEAFFLPENIYRWGDEWYLTGLFQYAPKVIHYDTAALLKRIYDENDDPMAMVTTYLNAYQQMRSFDEKEIHFLLAYLLYPEELIEAGLQTQGKESQMPNLEMVIEQATYKQEKWDALAEGVYAWSKSTIY